LIHLSSILKLLLKLSLLKELLVRYLLFCLIFKDHLLHRHHLTAFISYHFSAVLSTAFFKFL